jgi:pantoate kinase
MDKPMTTNTALFQQTPFDWKDRPSVQVLRLEATSMASYTVSCGGHITLLFSIWKDARLARSQGSRGAGFNVVDGVEVTVTHLGTNAPEQVGQISQGSTLDEHPTGFEDGEISLTVESMGGALIEQDDSFYTDLIQALRDARLLNPADSFDINVKISLPTSQGFGMSAAGLIAVARALHQHSGVGRESQYLRIAHRIERLHSGGLGDVLGIAAGGVELRLEPGAPGAGGKAVSFNTEQRVLLVWKPNEARHTAKYIDDAVWQRTISEAGEKAVRTLRLKNWDAGIWSDLMLQSRNFAQASGLLEEPERMALNTAVMNELRAIQMHTRVYVRLCMLGVSLTVLPRQLEHPLSEEEIQHIAEALRGLNFGVRATSISA